MKKWRTQLKNWFNRFANWNYLLLYKILGFNLFGGVLAFYAHLNGFFALVVESDPSNVSIVIGGLFLFIISYVFYKAFSVSREIDAVKHGKVSGKYHEFVTNVSQGKDMRYEGWAEALKLKIYSRIMFLRFLVSAPFVLGLIGTVIGFIMMTDGIETTTISDAADVSAMISDLVLGLGTALYTTLVGAIASLWGLANFTMLAVGTTNLIAHILEYEAKEVD